MGRKIPIFASKLCANVIQWCNWCSRSYSRIYFPIELSCCGIGSSDRSLRLFTFGFTSQFNSDSRDLSTLIATPIDSRVRWWLNDISFAVQLKRISEIKLKFSHIFFVFLYTRERFSAASLSKIYKIREKIFSFSFHKRRFSAQKKNSSAMRAALSEWRCLFALDTSLLRAIVCCSCRSILSTFWSKISFFSSWPRELINEIILLFLENSS